MKRTCITLLTGWVLLCSWAVSSPGAEERHIDDRDITLAVEAELLSDEGVFSHLMDATTQNGVVTLSGTVDHLLAKERAGEIAARIKGVREVVNEMVVKPPLPLGKPLGLEDETLGDEQLRRQVRGALQSDPATQNTQVDVQVAYRVVTLTGSADTWQGKRLVAQVAKSVKDIRGFDNQIEIASPKTRSDADIQRDIRHRLAYDVWVDAGLLTLDVKDGQVQLSGKVKSAAERSRVAQDAWVDGVKAVDARGIEVMWWLHDELQGIPFPFSLSDDAVAEAITNAFRYHPRVSPFAPQVAVLRGTAVLTGMVDNLAAKRAAAVSAKEIEGVWGVRNHLRVRPAPMPKDAQIAKALKAALERDVFVERHKINVNVRNGKALLEGRMDSHFEKDRAEEIASRVLGVVEIANRIDVAFSTTRKFDWQLRLDVEQKLLWNPFVDNEAITVLIDDGVVSLSGKVDNWLAHNLAIQSAYDAKAVRVRDRLEISRGPK